jgi:hypothetical protein
MEATLVLVLLLTFLVAGMTFALVMGYRGIEESRALPAARREATPSVADAVMIPGYFAAAGSRGNRPADLAFDEALLARLDQHVRAEHATVAQFVHYPSVDSLYRQSGSSLHVH